MLPERKKRVIRWSTKLQLISSSNTSLFLPKLSDFLSLNKNLSLLENLSSIKILLSKSFLLFGDLADFARRALLITALKAVKSQAFSLPVLDSRKPSY
jgi:hypothetical protein